MSKNSFIGLVANYFLSAVLMLTLVSLDFCVFVKPNNSRQIYESFTDF